MGYFFVFTSIGSSVLSQILIKWRIGLIYPRLTVPDSLFDKVMYLTKNIILDPIIVFCMACTFIGGLLWMAAMTRLPISVAYPLTSLGYVSVLVISSMFLGETFTLYKLVGVLFIMVGVAISSQG